MTGVSLATGGMVSPAITPACPTAAQIADAVWDEDLTTHTTAKSAGWFVRKIRATTEAFMGMLQ